MPKVAAVNDADSRTAWIDAHAGDTLVFKFPSNLPRELNGTPFYGLDIANGRLHPENAFKDFGRIKTIRLYHNGHPLCMIHLADTRRWQHVFPTSIKCRRYSGDCGAGYLSRQEGTHRFDC